MALIEIKHLYKKFVQKNDEVVALDDINLSIEKADIYGIIGMSGAGKSTLFKSVLKLIKADAEKVVEHPTSLMIRTNSKKNTNEF